MEIFFRFWSEATETEVEAWFEPSAPNISGKTAETKSQSKSKELKRKREDPEAEDYKSVEEGDEEEDDPLPKGAGMSGEDKLIAPDKNPATPPDTEEEARKRAEFNTEYPGLETDKEVWHAFSNSEKFDKDLKKILKKNANSHADQDALTWRIWKGFESRWRRYDREPDTKTLVKFTRMRKGRDLNETPELMAWRFAPLHRGIPLTVELDGVEGRAPETDNESDDDPPYISPNLPPFNQAHIRTQWGLRHLTALIEGGWPTWEIEIENLQRR